MTISIGFQDIELLSKNNNDDDNKQIKKYYFFYSNDKGVTSTVNIKVCIGWTAQNYIELSPGFTLAK